MIKVEVELKEDKGQGHILTYGQGFDQACHPFF